MMILTGKRLSQLSNLVEREQVMGMLKVQRAGIVTYLMEEFVRMRLLMILMLTME